MKHIHNILYGLLLLAGVSSCVTDAVYDDCPEGGEASAKNVQVMLSLSVPSSQLPSATRAITNDEAISNLYLLVFDNDTLTARMDITSKYQNANNGKFYVAVKESPNPVSLAIAANADVPTMLPTVGITKTEALQQLTFTGASNLSFMPMYGTTTDFNGISRDQTYDVTVNLIRALACIEVQYNSTQTQAEFQFLGIEVINTNADGYVADLGVLTQSPVASIPVTPTVISGPPNRQEKAMVYVAETSNNSPDKISVLIHGIYNGEDSWYRLDMIRSEESDEILKLERNFRYIFALQNVNFVGRTREEALTGDPDNKAFHAIVMTLTAAEGDILDITTDDQYFLGVNSSTLQLEDNGNICFTKLKVLTNNTVAGWTIVDAPAGVTFNPGITGGTGIREVSTVWIYIDTGVVTSDFDFYVTTGKIRKTITVRQP